MGPFDTTTKVLLTAKTALSIRNAVFPLFVSHTKYANIKKKAEQMQEGARTLPSAAAVLAERLQYRPVIVSIKNDEIKIIEKFYIVQPHSNGVHWPTPTIGRELLFKTFYTGMTRSSRGETEDEPRFIGLDQE